MLERAFGPMGMHRVFAQIREANAASIKCFESSGFRLEGKLRDAKLVNGEFKNALLYSILEDEWQRCV